MAGEQVPDWAKAPAADAVPEWAKKPAPTQEAKPAQGAKAGEEPYKPGKAMLDFIFGPAEAALNLGTSMVAKPVADVMGMSAQAQDAMRDKPVGNAGDFKDSVQRALTYEPRGNTGKAIAQYNPLALIGRGVNAVGGGVEGLVAPPGASAGRQMAGAGIHEAINQAPAFLGFKGAKATEGGIATPPRFAPDSPRVTIPKQTVDAGLKITPQMAGTTSPVAKVLGWVGGKTATEHQASAMNEAALPKLAAKDLGLPEGTPILPANLKPIRDEYSKLVNQITRADTSSKQAAGMSGAAGPKASNPVWRADDQLRSAADKIWSDSSTIATHEGKPLPKEFAELKAVLAQSDYPPGYAMPKIKTLRAQATESYRRGDYQLGAAQKATANALEDFVERGLEKKVAEEPQAVTDLKQKLAPIGLRLDRSGSPELVKAFNDLQGKLDAASKKVPAMDNSSLLKRFRDARQRVAKSYDYEAAADDMGNINAAKLAKVGNDKPLSGQAKTIATAANQYPRAFQSTARTGGAADHSVASLGTAAIEGAQGNIGTALGVLAGRPLARKALLSDYAQRNWVIPQNIPRVSTYQQALALAHNNPQALAAILQANQIQPPPPQ